MAAPLNRSIRQAKRLRPVLVASLGFVPMACSQLLQGGSIMAIILTLYLLPLLYLWFSPKDAEHI